MSNRISGFRHRFVGDRACLSFRRAKPLPSKRKVIVFSDAHVQPRVATDAELAMAMAKVILEEGLEDRGFLDRHAHGFAEYRALLDTWGDGGQL